MYKPCYELKYTWDNLYECTKFMEYHGLGKNYFDPFDTFPDEHFGDDPHWFDDIMKNPEWDTVTPHNRDLDPPWFPTNARKWGKEWTGLTLLTTTEYYRGSTERPFLWFLQDPNGPNLNSGLKERTDDNGFYSTADLRNLNDPPKEFHDRTTMRSISVQPRATTTTRSPQSNVASGVRETPQRNGFYSTADRRNLNDPPKETN